MRCGYTLLSSLCAAPAVLGFGLPNDLLIKIKARLADGATHSWELGTRMQALLEFDIPTYSTLTPRASLPPPKTTPASLSEVVQIARFIVGSKGNDTGPQPFMVDGSAADPASNGVGIILANWTGEGKADGLDYAGAAKDQLDYLYQKVPHASNGAISHRENYVQLWSDFVFMVPPFISYYGIITSNPLWITEGFNQIKYYRELLLDKSAGGLWKHVLLGPSTNAPPNDEGHWSTGNAWAAAGMLRVFGTIKNSKYASAMRSEQENLASWIEEIHDAMYPHLPSSGIFTNYADDSSTFPDAASTALLAATVYRAAKIAGPCHHFDAAEKSRTALSARAANGTYAHFDQDGWLTPVVNPNAYGARGSKSPEGQAFVLMMQAAYHDFLG